MILKRLFAFCGFTLKKSAILLCFLLPFFQLRGRAITNFIVAFIAILFLFHTVFRKKYAELLHGWFPYAMALWGLMVLSSVLDHSLHAVLESLAILRYFVFAKALEAWLLDNKKDRQILGFSVTLAALWVLVECWQQYIWGTNIWGFPRWVDGALTGPFFDPRAGPALMITMFPGLMIYPLYMVQNKSIAQRVAGFGILSFLLLTMVIIGQRMPALLVFFGLFVCAILLKTTRVPVLLSTLAGSVGLALLPVISPPAYNKLVLHFFAQIRDFPHSPYGQIFMRALNMLYAHPLLGLGFDGFRRHCADTAYLYTIPQFAHLVAGQDPAVGCNIHPHNIYLEVATTVGLVGLCVFVCLVVVWMKRLLRSALTNTSLMPSMLFITLCMVFWPLASTSSLFTERTAGWVFLLLGWGLSIAKSTHKSLPP
ncbi:O-antigen ligase family protein [Acetobacter ghanensis]|uniref:O-antigen ligase family protein n=1 Tax=Acetobacter ghanensis TaxID=431306 RepID=A0A0U5EZY1_9PROT|nr:O-antigen ligase family protein [Acetobacter ghanensis]NHO39766.1 O-antigen ligase family protein [Acetobacter ghanensis]GBQ49193.1 hypothetical protein AA18895_1551 [Acetobacter ghanensis DSM 18895]CEF53368.1 hypothetical protein AGA_177 [Acetobacter ghanensis]